MKKKLLVALAASAVVLVGAGAGTHYVITGNIEDVIAKLEARTPGLDLQYSRYSLDPLGLELALHDVEMKAPIANTQETMTVKADRIVYRECDFENELPRRCAGAVEGMTLAFSSPELMEPLKKLEDAVGQPLKLDIVSDSHYEPAARFRLQSDATVTWAGAGSASFAFIGGGVDLEAASKKMQTLQAELEGLPDDQKMQATMAAASEWMGLEIDQLKIGVDSETLLAKAFASLDAMTQGQPRLEFLDGIAASSPKLAALLQDPGVRAFIESPKSLSLGLDPAQPMNMTALATKAVAGADLASLNLTAAANGTDVPLATILGH